jgi:hypothetical protein
LVGQPPCRGRSPWTVGDTFEPKRIVVSEQHSADNQPIYPYYAYVVTLHPTQSVQLFAQRRLQEAGDATWRVAPLINSRLIWIWLSGRAILGCGLKTAGKLP